LLLLSAVSSCSSTVGTISVLAKSSLEPTAGRTMVCKRVFSGEVSCVPEPSFFSYPTDAKAGLPAAKGEFGERGDGATLVSAAAFGGSSTFLLSFSGPFFFLGSGFLLRFIASRCFIVFSYLALSAASSCWRFASFSASIASNLTLRLLKSADASSDASLII
jgi:hypothetical protein